MRFLLREIEKKPVEYIFIGLVFFLTLVLFYFFRFNPVAQRQTVYTVGLIYFCWSLYHHYRRGDLAPAIVIEYLVIILLGLVVVTFTLF